MVILLRGAFRRSSRHHDFVVQVIAMDVGRLRIMSFVYLILLFLMTVVPLGPLNATLNDNYTLNIRWDYLLHALVYLPLPYFMTFMLRVESQNRGINTVRHSIQFLWMVILSGMVVVLFEGIQKILPYRSFNINDMLANGIGAMLGLLLLRLLRRSLIRWSLL
jgi:glycopeptide antibiotics resistance protein